MENLDNYREDKLTVNIVSAHLFGLVILVVVVVIFGIPYFLLRPEHITIAHFQTICYNSGAVIGSSLIFGFLIIISGIILHEFIHGLTWAKFANKGFKSIKFGVKWKMLAPYCHCKEPLLLKHYILGTLMPAIILGIVPVILSLVLGSIILLLIGIFFTIAASGDFIIVYLLSKQNMNDYVQDHPSEVGCYLYHKKR